jgi:hypothetical protein
MTGNKVRGFRRGVSSNFSWLRRAGGGGANPLHTIGALTRVGAGGRAIPAANGTYGPYTVASGIMTPNTAPVTPGTYNVGGVTITAEADTYDVLNATEYAAVLALGGATIAGKTIKGLPGADLAGTSPGNSVSYPGTLTLASPLVVTSRDPLNPCFHRRANFRQNGTIRFQQMTIRDTYLLSDNVNSSTILQFSPPSAGRSRVILDRVTGTGGNVGAIDTSIVLQATAAAHTNGATSTTITLTGSPDLTPVATDRSMSVRLGSSNRVITGKDNVAKTLTIENAVNIPLASPVDYIICYTPQILTLIGQDGGISSRPDLQMTGCNFSNFSRVLTGGSGWNDLLLENNDVDQQYNDHFQIIVIGNEARVDILRNRFRRAHGWYTDPLNPHVDAVQFVCMNMTSDNTVPYRIIGNLVWQADGRAHDTQCFFVEGAPATRRVLVHAEHNAGMTASTHMVTVERPAVGTVIRGNTGVLDNSGTDPQILYPALAVNVGPSPVDAGVTVAYNVACAVSATSAAAFANHTFGLSAGANNGTAYAALFAGTSGQFQGAGLASFDQFRAALTPDTATLWPVGRVRRGAMSGYYDYATGVSDAPWDEAGWSASRAWGNVTGAATNATVIGNKIQVSGTSATGTAVRVSGGVNPTVTIYDTDSTTVIASGVPDALALNGQWVEPRDTTAGTGLTLSTVTVEAGTTSGTWTHETGVAAYAPSAVEFDGTNDWLATDSGITATGGKQALVGFSFHVPTTWPTSGTILSMANAGGFAQFSVTYNSGRNLTLTARNSAGTTIGSYLTAANGFNVDGWWTIAIELDTNTGKGWRVYRRLAGGSWVLDVPSTQSFTVDGIMGSCTRLRFGAANLGGGIRVPLSYYSDVYASLDRTLDLSVGANRDQFLPLTDRNTDGSAVTGAPPQLYLSGAVGSWHTNKGAGGGLGLFGALTAAPSTPS